MVQEAWRKTVWSLFAGKSCSKSRLEIFVLIRIPVKFLQYENYCHQNQKKKKIIFFPVVHSTLHQAITGTQINHTLIQPDFYERLQLSCGTLAHLSAVYCILFDVTGKHIFTVSVIK